MLNWLTRFEKVLTYAAVGATFSLMILTTADAIFRYVINWPIRFAYEITETYLMPSAVYLAICYAYRQGNFIQVTFLVDRFSQETRKVLRFIVHMITTLLTIIFLLGMFYQTQYNLSKDIPPDTLPVGPGYLIVTISLLLLSCTLIADLIYKKSEFLKKASDTF